MLTTRPAIMADLSHPPVEVTDDYLCHDSWPISYCDLTGDISRSRMVNDYVCYAGRNSGISCGTVTSIDHRPSHCRNARNTSVTCDNVYVTVTGNSLHGCRGDSGGPVYRLGIAYGIIKSVDTTDADNCSIEISGLHFSAIHEVETFLGVQILTGGSVTIG
jgi:hypothetical protein